MYSSKKVSETFLTYRKSLNFQRYTTDSTHNHKADLKINHSGKTNFLPDIHCRLYIEMKTNKKLHENQEQFERNNRANKKKHIRRNILRF